MRIIIQSLMRKTLNKFFGVGVLEIAVEQKKLRRHSLHYIFSILKMATATFSSRVLGLIREQVMAAMFGASLVTDAFNVAFRIPNVLRDLFAEGVFQQHSFQFLLRSYNRTRKKRKGFLVLLRCFSSFRQVSYLWALFFLLPN